MKAIVTVVGKDRVGIIAGVCTAMEEKNAEDEEFDMFCKYYEALLREMNYPDITTEKIRALAYDNVFNDEKIELFPDVEKLLKALSKNYDLYIISNAWPSTYRLLKHLGIYELFTGVFISSTFGFTKDDKTLFEIALTGIDPDDKNYFIDDRIDLVLSDGKIKAVVE